MKSKIYFSCLCFFICSHNNAQTVQRLIEPVNFSEVNITDAFWKPKIDLVSTVTLQACIDQTETKTPRIRNFEKVARMGKGVKEKHEGIFYDDSDVYKALEAIAYSLKSNPNPTLQSKAEEWIDKIAAAQQPDGYLNTYFTLGDITKRYTDMSMHEDYNAGHLIEAAVAYFNATGKRKFLDVAIRWADHFDALFGPGKKNWVTGHQELELALVKLYKTTGNEKYLKLAHWLLEERGHKLAYGYTWTDWKDTAYTQDVVPVREQKKITGHAVRAMYMYTGAADVAALTGDVGYVTAMKTVWQDVVYRNMYITGGIGSSGSNEGFSVDYDLPNEQAYCETCASVGMVFWNQRMNALTGESKYIDVLERSLYNGALDGLSLSGDHFFYGNPLASTGKNARREWFGTACCPSNIARLVTSLGDYIYGKSIDGIWINLFVGSDTKIPMLNGPVGVKMETNYPWEGKVKLKFDTELEQEFNLHIRVPGWSQNEPVPGDLYNYENKLSPEVDITVNGKKILFGIQNGYIILNKKWKAGDVVEMTLPMNVRKIISSDSIGMNKNRIALQRGPLVYCVEGADNDGKAWNFILPDNATITTSSEKILTENIIALQAKVPVLVVGDDGYSVKTVQKKITAIPYYTWCNRGKNAMQVWLPRKIVDLKVNGL